MRSSLIMLLAVCCGGCAAVPLYSRAPRAARPALEALSDGYRDLTGVIQSLS